MSGIFQKFWGSDQKFVSIVYPSPKLTTNRKTYTLWSTVKVKPGHTVVLSKNDEIVQFENANESEARFVLISGQPLNEPIGKSNLVENFTTR